MRKNAFIYKTHNAKTTQKEQKLIHRQYCQVTEKAEQAGRKLCFESTKIKQLAKASRKQSQALSETCFPYNFNKKVTAHKQPRATQQERLHSPIVQKNAEIICQLRRKSILVKLHTKPPDISGATREKIVPLTTRKPCA